MIKTTIAAALISFTALAAVPAQASDLSIQIGYGGSGYGWNDGDGHGYRHHHRMRRLSTEEIGWMLRDSGYRHVSFFDNRGPVYRLRAWWNGDRYLLAVSASTGEILYRRMI